MRAVIIGGAPISDYENCKEYLKPDDFYIFCDSGLYHMEPLGVKPSLIIGDFDSHPMPETDVETIVLPTVKDDTDTVFAAKEAIKRGFDDFLIIGAVGARLDHTLVNVYLLVFLEKQGKTATLVDDFGEMLLVGQNPVFVDKEYCYFSLLNIDGSAKGVTIEGAKYNLENAEILPDYQYATSNEILEDKAKITLKQGRLLLIKIK